MSRPSVEIVVHGGEDADYQDIVLFSSHEMADSVDPQDLQDALSAAFHDVEQRIWESTEPDCADCDCCGVDDLISSSYPNPLDEYIRSLSLVFTNLSERTFGAGERFSFSYETSYSGYDQPDHDFTD